jgi:hypothetical protein
MNSTARPDRLTNDGQVTIDYLPCCSRVSLPERGAALDVGEEKGDGAGGEIGHDPLQTLGEMLFGTIVA